GAAGALDRGVARSLPLRAAATLSLGLRAEIRQGPAAAALLRFLPAGRALGTRLQHLIGRFAVDGLVVSSGKRAPRDDAGALRVGDGAEPRGWRADQGPLHHGGYPFFLQRRDQRLAGPEPGDGFETVEVGIGPEGVGRRPDRLLLARRIGA